VGFVVPKHGQSNVARNRLKRRLREIARLKLLPELPPVDVVIRARREAYVAGFDALAAQLARAGGQLIAQFRRR
jgi:ribonuclease P protein component